MEIHTDTILTWPRKLVYETYRDRLAELVPYLPNIEGITVLSSERDGSDLHLLNEWKGKGDIPRVARSIIKPEMLKWKDFADWHDDEWCVDWRMELAFLNEVVETHGRNRFVEIGDDRTRLEIRGILDIDGTRIPGVPRLVGRKIAPQIEKFVVSMIKPNLVKTADGVQRFLDEQG